MSTQKSKRSLSHIRFLISGITLIVYYLLSQGVPSVGNSLDSLRKFIIEVFVLVLLIGFYFFFLFGANGCQGTLRAIAPALLILIVVGSYSLNFWNDTANTIITGVAKLFYLLIIVCGFVFLFVHNKLIGLVFSFSNLIYAAFVIVSYFVVRIRSLVNHNGFSVSKLIETLLYTASLLLLFGGEYLTSKNKSWTVD